MKGLLPACLVAQLLKRRFTAGPLGSVFEGKRTQCTLTRAGPCLSLCRAAAGQGGGAVSMDGYDKMWVLDSTFAQSYAGVRRGLGSGRCSAAAWAALEAAAGEVSLGKATMCRLWGTFCTAREMEASLAGGPCRDASAAPAAVPYRCSTAGGRTSTCASPPSQSSTSTPTPQVWLPLALCLSGLFASYASL